MPRSKRYQELKKLIDPKKVYPPVAAIELAKQTSSTKFDSTIEVHVNLGIDVKKSEQNVRATLLFPHAVGKAKRVAAFVSSEKEKDAQEAGADLVGGPEIIDDIARTGKIEFDVAVATPDMMPKLAKVAKILGPKGLMPNPKTETVGPNVRKMVEELKKGKVAFKNDATGNIHQTIGKASFDADKLLTNFIALIEAIKRHKPPSAKGMFIRSVTLTSTMGPGIKVDVSGI